MIDPGLLSLNEPFQMNIRIYGIKIPGEDEKKDDGIFSGRQYAGMYGYVYNPGYYYRNPGYEQVSDIFRDDSFKF